MTDGMELSKKGLERVSNPKGHWKSARNLKSNLTGTSMMLLPWSPGSLIQKAKVGIFLFRSFFLFVHNELSYTRQ